MPISILMPALSPTMTEGNLAAWLKKEGDIVKSGDVLAEIETDKATMEVEACDDGILGKILIPAGTEGVAVGSAIALLLEEDEDPSSLHTYTANSESAQLNKTQEPPLAPATASASVTPSQGQSCSSHSTINNNCAPALSSSHDERIVASPLAKCIAKQENLSLIGMHGSGPYGRIVKADVLEALQSKTTTANTSLSGETHLNNTHSAYTDTPMSSMRKVIAKRLSDAKATIPHFYLSMNVCIDALIATREKLNSSSYIKTKISVNDFVVKAVAHALERVPNLCATFHDTFTRKYTRCDVCVAVSVPGGLITPIVDNAQTKNLTTISLQIKDLATRAKESTLKPHEYQGGCFTVSNLGMFGIEQFQAIINPPQVAILAVGAGVKRMGASKEQTFMNLTLSLDHRAVDGADGAAFLNVLKDLLEHPEYLIVL